jgi:hypothetical protein
VGEHTHNLSGHTASPETHIRTSPHTTPDDGMARSTWQQRGMGMNEVPLTTKDMAAAPLTTAAPTTARHTTAGPASAAPIDVGRSLVQGSGTLCRQTSPLPQIHPHRNQQTHPPTLTLTAHTTRTCLRCAPRNRGHNVSRENVSADHRANTCPVASLAPSKKSLALHLPPPSLSCFWNSNGPDLRSPRRH